MKDGNLKPIFGANLKSLRKNAGYKNQQAFADAFGRSLDTIQNWEQGKNWPTMEDFLLLCEHFGCDADYLSGRLQEKTHDLHFICSETGLSEKTASLFIANPELAKPLDWLDGNQLSMFIETLGNAYDAFDDCVEFLEDPNPKNWSMAAYQKIHLEYATMYFQDVCRQVVTEWCDMKRILSDLDEREKAYKSYLATESKRLAEENKPKMSEKPGLDERLFLEYRRSLEGLEEEHYGKHTED